MLVSPLLAGKLSQRTLRNGTNREQNEDKDQLSGDMKN
jgi:hypothetical protein